MSETQNDTQSNRNNFDQVPTCPLSKKQQRRCMEAETCQKCTKWFETFGGQQQTSRHRIAKRRPPTPPGFWDLEFDDTIEIPILPPDYHNETRKKKNKYDIPPKKPTPVTPSATREKGWMKAEKPVADNF